MTISNDLGTCESIVNYSIPEAADNCEITSISLTQGLPSGSSFPLGDTTIEYTYLDSSGNSSVCQFIVTIIDSGNITRLFLSAHGYR